MKILRHHFDTIDSTNSWAKEHASSFESNAITVISADVQTHGRGRFPQRKWLSPAKENICVTVCFFVKHDRSDIGNSGQVMALSIVELLQLNAFTAKIKWPNDIMLANGKVAGILTEAVNCDQGLCLIIGVGINVNCDQTAFASLDRPITSLFMASGKTYFIEALTEKLVEIFAAHLELFLREGFGPFLQGYQEHLIHQLSDPITFSDRKSTWRGSFQSINADGSLSLLLPDGTTKFFFAGEIN